MAILRLKMAILDFKMAILDFKMAKELSENIFIWTAAKNCTRVSGIIHFGHLFMVSGLIPHGTFQFLPPLSTIASRFKLKFETILGGSKTSQNWLII